MRFAAAFLALLIALPAQAQFMMGGGGAATSINGWSMCRRMRIDHTKVPNSTPATPSDLSNARVPFDSKVNPGLQNDLKKLAYGGVVTNDLTGYDILFYPDALGGAGGAKIPHEPIFYDGTTGERLAYLKINVSHTVDTFFWVCAGKASIVTDQADTANVYHSSYKGAWNFGTPTSLSVDNSTANSITGTNNNGVTAIQGQFGAAAHFTRASTQSIGLGNPTALRLQDSRTIEFTYHLDTAPAAGAGGGGNYFTIYKKQDEDGGTWARIGNLADVNGNGPTMYLNASSAGGAVISNNATPLAGDTKQVAFVYDRSTHTISEYVDCALAATYDFWPGVSDSGPNAAIGGGMNGWIGNLTISDVARHSDYVVMGCLMHKNPSLILSAGPRL